MYFVFNVPVNAQFKTISSLHFIIYKKLITENYIWLIGHFHVICNNSKKNQM